MSAIGIHVSPPSCTSLPPLSPSHLSRLSQSMGTGCLFYIDIKDRPRDTKGTFHAKIGPIKDRNSMELTEAEDIKKRWQEYTEELYKKDLHDPVNHNGVIIHLEPNIPDVKSSGP